MTLLRLPLLLAFAGLAGLAILAALHLPVTPAYLAAWLFWMALPLGALPTVMLLELLGVRAWAVLPVLRRLLLLLPPGALLAIPLMARAAPLFHRPGFPEWWAQTPFLLVRMVTMLVLWAGFALLFSRTPARPRRAAAAIGLMLHLAMGTVAAIDWLLSIEPGFGSASLGLILMAAQAGAAICAAGLLLAAMGEVPPELPPLMFGVLLVWAYLHTNQYLIVWSANLPAEVAWFQRRTTGLGAPALWATFAAGLVALGVLLHYRTARIPWMMASLAAMLLMGHAVEMLWLATPAFRGGFRFTWADLPALAGFSGLAVFILTVLPHPRRADA